MRLYAYRDRAHGYERFGVLVEGGLISAGDLERRGRLKLTTYYGIGGTIVFAADYDVDWRKEVERALERAVRRGAKPKLLTTRRPAAAIRSPGKIVCVGLNYLDHIEEQHIDPPDRPLLFAKFPASVIADGEPIVRPAGTHASISRPSSAWSSASGPDGSSRGRCDGPRRRLRRRQ